jgi:hypothetical protein
MFFTTPIFKIKQVKRIIMVQSIKIFVEDMITGINEVQSTAIY